MKRVGLDLCSLSGERAARGMGVYTLHLSRALVGLLRTDPPSSLDFYLFSFLAPAALEELLGPFPANVKAVRVWGSKGRLQTLLGHQIGLALLAARYRLDILHSPGFGVDPSQPGLPPLFPPTRRLTTMHDLIPWHYPEIFLTARRKRFWYGLMLRRVCRSAYIVTNSEHTRHDLIVSLGFDPAKIKCTPLAADQFATVEPRLPSGAPVQPFILVVAGPQPHKNLARLLHAFSHWRTQPAQNGVVNMVIIGAGDSRVALAQILPPYLQSKVAWFNGLPIEEIAGLYQAARFLAFPSLYEGFGLPILEAMTLGCPVLCSDNAALPEIGGQAAYYVNPLDELDIEKGLNKMWHDEALRQQLKAAGHSQVQKFSWQHTAELTLDVYQKIL